MSTNNTSGTTNDTTLNKVAQRPTALPFKLDPVPIALRNIPRWVLWRFTPKKGSEDVFAKVPYQVSGRGASVNKPDNWSTFNDCFDEFALSDFDGLGFVLDGSDGIVGIDLDDCVRDDGTLSDIAQELLARVQGYAELSPSGTGIKMFTRAELARQYVDNSKGIEIYPEGRYFTVTGHAWNGHKDLPAEPQDIDWFIRKHFDEVMSAGPVDALALYKSPLPDWDLLRVRDELLSHIEPACGYGEWVQVGQALYHQFDGAIEAMELWDAWSAGIVEPCSKYVAGACEDKWESFTSQRAKGHGPVTLATVIKLAADALVKEKRENADLWVEKVNDCADSHVLHHDICHNIARDTMLDSVGREVLAHLIQKKFRSLDYPLPISMVRDLVRPRTSGYDYSNKPIWLAEWVYVTHEDKFFHLGTKRRVSTQGFNAEFNREVGGEDANAAKFALDICQIPVVSRVMYIPWADDIFTDGSDGQQHANTYRPTSVPSIIPEWTDEARMACDVVDQHIRMLCGADSQQADYLKWWIAHNVQNPGIKIRWSPLIKGIQGDGKSTLGKLVSSVMGPDNVSEISPKAITTDFNGWSEGSCVGVLDEIRISGHNRHDIADRLKPYISNDRIAVHKKGIDEYTAVNTVNYIAFTNHDDAMPLEDSDRRWFVIFTPFRSKEQLLMVADDAYFTRLHDAIYGMGGALRRWFLEMVIPDTFKPNGHAPYTDAKRIMTNMNVTDEEMIARDIIESGAVGVCKKVIDSASLNLTLVMTYQMTMKTSQINRLVAKMGYDQLNWTVRWQGKTRRVWFDPALNLNNIERTEAFKVVRDLLDETLVDDIDDLLK